jgi:hypothetical protein
MKGHGEQMQSERKVIDCLVTSVLKQQEGHWHRPLIREAAVRGRCERETGR